MVHHSSKIIVSILLVVELAFEDYQLKMMLYITHRFNPSCSGIGF